MKRFKLRTDTPATILPSSPERHVAAHVKTSAAPGAGPTPKPRQWTKGCVTPDLANVSVRRDGGRDRTFLCTSRDSEPYGCARFDLDNEPECRHRCYGPERGNR